MTNADLFRNTFDGLFATEMWVMSLDKFLEWLNSEVPEPQIEPTDIAPETKAWLDSMSAEERLHTIAAICVDWDGYRTARGLGSLLNEIWAYALYPVKEKGE